MTFLEAAIYGVVSLLGVFVLAFLINAVIERAFPSDDDDWWDWK